MSLTSFVTRLHRVGRERVIRHAALFCWFSGHMLAGVTAAAPPDRLTSLSPSAEVYFGQFAVSAPEVDGLENEVLELLDSEFRPMARETITKYAPSGEVTSKTVRDITPRSANGPLLNDQQKERILKAVTAGISEPKYHALPDVRKLEIRKTIVDKVQQCLGTVPGEPTTEEDWQVHLEDLKRRVAWLAEAPIYYPEDPEAITDQLDHIVTLLTEQIVIRGDSAPFRDIQFVLKDRIARLSNSSVQPVFKSTLPEERLRSLNTELQGLVEDVDHNGHIATISGRAAAHQLLAPVLGPMTITLVEAFAPPHAGQQPVQASQEDPEHSRRMREAHDRVLARQQRWLEARRKEFRSRSEAVAAAVREKTARARTGQLDPVPAEDLSRNKQAVSWSFIIVCNALAVVGIAATGLIRRRRRTRTGNTTD